MRRCPPVVLARGAAAVVATIAACLGAWPAFAARTPYPAADAVRSAVPTPDHRPDATRGLALFAEHCSECHGSFGGGDGARSAEMPAEMPDFGAATWARAARASEAYEVIADGRPTRGMPAWRERLAEADLWDVLYGAWSFYFTPDRIARGREAWRAACADCHEAGAADGAARAIVTTWPADMLLEAAQTELLSRTLAVAGPHDVPGRHDRDVIESAVDYARATTFSPLPYADLVVGGTIRGRIVAGAPDVGALSASEVRLAVFASGLPGEPVAAPVVSPTGAYTVSHLVAGAGMTYRVVVRFDGADYVADDEIALDETASARAADTVVYRADARVQLRARAAHFVVTPRPERSAARVSEVWVLANESRRTRVAAAAGATLRFALPGNAIDVAFEDARWAVGAALEHGTLLSAAPLPPGEHTVVLGYDVPYLGTRLDLERRVDLTTDSLRVIVASVGAHLSSAELGPAETVDLQGERFVHAVATDLSAGAAVSAHISDLPPAERAGAAAQAVVPLPQGAVPAPTARMVGALLSLIAVVLALAYPVLEPPRRSAAQTAAREYDGVIDALVELDRRRARGDLDAATHGAARARLTAQAAALLARMNESERTR